MPGTQDILAAAALQLLRPLVRILLRNGVAYGTFAEIAKKAFVEVARAEFTEPGRRPTDSHVSALTGLTRKEVRRLRELEGPHSDAAEGRYNRAVRVLSGWVNDPAYQGPEGPAGLPLEGGAGSFAALVREYSGDVPTQAMLAVLQAADCVALEQGRVRLLRRAYIPAGDPAEKIRILGSDTHELIATIDHNLTAAPGDLRFQRKVSTARLARRHREAFRRLAARRSQALLETLDAWLTRHEVDAAAGEPACYVSLGIHYFEPTERE